jgi:hypothetical protein
MTGPAAPPKPRKHRRWLGHLQTLGRATYLLAIQSLVGAVALVLFVYLGVNSPSAPAVVSRVLSEALPGDLSVQALHWGPSPGHLELRRVKVYAHGQQVLSARRLVAELRWFRLLDSVLRGKTELVLGFDSLLLQGGDLRLGNDKLGRLLLPQAFADPDKPPEPKDPNARQIRLSITQFRAVDTAFLMEIPAIRIRAQQASMHGTFDLKTHADLPPEVSWQVRDVHVPIGEAKPEPMRDLPPTPQLTLQVAEVNGSLERVRVSGVDAILPAQGHWHELQLPDTVMLGADLAVQLQPVVEVDARHIQLATSSASQFMGQLLGKQFDARALVDGGFRVDEQGFRAEGDVVGDGLLAGFQLTSVKAHTVVEAGPPGGPLVRVVATGLDARGYGGSILSPRLEYRMLGSAGTEPTHLVQGQFKIHDLAPGAVLTSQAVAMSGMVPLALQGSLSGELGAAVRVKIDPATVPPIDLDVALDLDLLLLRHGVAVPLVAEVPRLLAKGGILFGMGPQRGPVLDLDELVVHTAERHDSKLAGHEWLKASGRLDMGAKDTDLRVAASIPHLAHVLAPLGIKGVDGSIELGATHVHGSLLTPQVAGTLRASHLTAQGHEIRTLSTDVRLQHGALQLTHLKADSDLALVQGEVELHLLDDAGTLLTHKLLHVHGLQISRLDLGVTLPQFGITDITGQARLDHGEVSMDLANPKKSIQFGADVAGSKLVVYGESFPEAAAHVALHGKRAVLREANAKLWNGRTATASGEFHLDTQRFAASLDLPEVDLTTVHAVSAKELPVRGTVSAHLEAEGDRHGVDVHDTVLHLTDLGYGKIELGSADLRITKTHDGPAVFSSDRFFPHFKLLAGTEASFAGQKPQQVVIHIATDGKLDPFVLMGLDRPPNLAVTVDADVVATLDLRPGQPLYTVEAKMPTSGLDVDLGSGLQRLRNATPLAVKVTPQGAEIGSLVLELGREQLELCGRFDFADAVQNTPAQILLFVAGAVDVPRYGPLAQTLATLDLRLDLLPHPDVVKDQRAACLKFKEERGRLRVEGPLEALRIDGALQTRAGHVALRRFGHDITIAEGGRLEIDAVGHHMTVRVPEDHPLRGGFDDGKWSTSGVANLLDGQPVKIDFAATGQDVPWSSPKEYAVTVTPELKFVGTHMDDPQRREMKLTGSVEVHDGVYYRSFDRLGGLFGNLADRRVDSFSKPLKESMPWLAEVGLGLDIHSTNFEFNSQFPLLKFEVVSDVDLRVEGTVFEPQVFDRVKVKDGSGSLIHYAINHIDFEILRGALDFHGDPTKPYLDLVLTANIPVRSANVGSRAQMGLGADLSPDTTSGDFVVITVSASGVLGDPNFKLGFSSNQGDSESDVQYIIATGKRRTDTSGGAPQIGTAVLMGQSGNEAAQLVRKIAGLDTLSFDYDPASNATALEVTKKVGKQITLAAKVLGGREENRYGATFAFRMSNELSFNGLWRRQQLTVGGLQEQPIDLYDFKLRYRSPLE